MKETIGEKIKRLRKEMRFTQENVHNNQSQISQIESGRISNPDENTLLLIAKNMEIPFDELISDTTWVKPEVASIGKEIGFSPAAFNIEIDDHLNIEWSHRSFPLVNDNDEKNEFCPYSGLSLISKCERCNRKIEKSDQKYCFGCGLRLFEEVVIYESIREMCSDMEVNTYYESCRDSLEHLNYILGENKSLYSLVLNFKECDSPKLLLEEIEARRKDAIVSLANSTDYIRMKRMIFADAKEDLRPSIRTYSIIELNNQICLALIKKFKKVMKGLTPAEGLTVDETKARLFQRVAGNIDDYLSHIPGDESFGFALSLFHSLSKKTDDEELMSKMQSILNDLKENSEDGNSETAAENETEQDTNNAEDKDNGVK